MQGRNGGAVRRDSAALRARMLWVSFKKLHAHPHTHMSGTLVCRTTDASSLNLPIRNGHCLPPMARRAELAPCGRPDCQLWPLRTPSFEYGGHDAGRDCRPRCPAGDAGPGEQFEVGSPLCLCSEYLSSRVPAGGFGCRWFCRQLQRPSETAAGQVRGWGRR